MTLLARRGGAAACFSSDRKSTRLNSSHLGISYAVFCLKKKKVEDRDERENDNPHRKKNRASDLLRGGERVVPRFVACERAGVFCFRFFFFNDTATTEIYTLSLHDALPISVQLKDTDGLSEGSVTIKASIEQRSEEHTSELQSLRHLVCSLLHETKKTE